MTRGPKKQERMPFQPLAEFVGAQNMCHLGRILGIAPTNLHKYKNDGIPIYRADKIAVKTLGVHPGFIWKKEWVKQ